MRGDIRQRAKGSWTLTIELLRDPVTGKRRQAYETVRGTKRDALRRLSELEVQVDRGEHVNPSHATVGQFLYEWLDGIVATTTRETTVAGYRWYVGKYIIPRIGHVPLKDLQAAHIQSLYADMLAEGLSPTTVAQAHRIIRRALGQGVKQGALIRNVADATTPPRPARKEMRTLSEEDVARFLLVARQSPLYGVFLSLLYTGARRSEILALKWRNVDLVMGTITISRALHVLKGGRVVFSEPKSAKGRRQVAMPPSLALALTEHRETMEQIRGPLSEDGLVFTRLDGSAVRPLTVSHAFRRISRRVGLHGVRLHDLRHSHATLMLEQGVHPKVVSERLGHSSVAITLDVYSHVLPGIQHAAAEDLRQSASQRTSRQRCR